MVSFRETWSNSSCIFPRLCPKIATSATLRPGIACTSLTWAPMSLARARVSRTPGALGRCSDRWPRWWRHPLGTWGSYGCWWLSVLVCLVIGWLVKAHWWSDFELGAGAVLGLLQLRVEVGRILITLSLGDLKKKKTEGHALWGDLGLA